MYTTKSPNHLISWLYGTYYGVGSSMCASCDHGIAPACALRKLHMAHMLIQSHRSTCAIRICKCGFTWTWVRLDLGSTLAHPRVLHYSASFACIAKFGAKYFNMHVYLVTVTCIIITVKTVIVIFLCNNNILHAQIM